MLQPFGRKKLFFIVVGSGRCGTVYFAHLLNSIGISCSHERVFGPKGLEHAVEVLHQGGEDSAVAQWSGLKSRNFILAESSYMAAPYLNYGTLSEATIIHAVRNPIDVILSFHNKLQFWHDELQQYEHFILSHLPEIKQYKNPLMKNCCYVVRWNQWIEKQSVGRKYLRIRVEKDTNLLLDHLRIPKGLRPKIGKVNEHTTWKRKKEPLIKPATAEDILNSGFGNQVRLLARNYGYEI